jgi:hypothetical protein
MGSDFGIDILHIEVEAIVVAVLVDRKDLKILFVVGRTFKDLPALVAAGDDMVEGAFKFYAGFAEHGRILAGKRGQCQFQSLGPHMP